jgi:hypothetical protein
VTLLSLYECSLWSPPAAEARKYAAHEVWVRSDCEPWLAPVFDAVQIRNVKSIEGSVGRKDALT